MAKYRIDADHKLGKIHKELQGHFSEHLGRCIYEGIYVGEDSEIPNVHGMRTDVVKALKEIRVPVLRWPGGCFADEYHWKDGIGPKETRKKMINTHWGGVTEDNSFGTHEFMELCRQLGCEAYINGNLGSGTVQEMSEWVEYMTSDAISPMTELRRANGREEPWKVDFFGVGNESWGCGGNMTPEYYANEYRRYQTYVRQYASSDQPEDIDNPELLRKIACGPSDFDTEWTETLMKTLFRHCPPHLHGNTDGISLHYYTLPGDWDKKGSATDFDVETYYRTLGKSFAMEDLIRMHGDIMDRYDPEKKIGLIVDEWGTWYDVEPGTNPGFLYQQNTMRDALVAAMNLNIFNKHCDRVKMANIAQMVNVLQSVLLTEGPKMVKTPTWHVFDLFKVHQEAQLVESSLETEQIWADGKFTLPNMSESVSVDAEGRLQITLANFSSETAYPIDAEIAGMTCGQIQARILTGRMGDKNTFENPEAVGSTTFDEITKTAAGFRMNIPPCSVVRTTAYGDI